MLDREEYIEQTHFFRTLKARMGEGLSTQDLLASVREEILATTKLPMAIDFMAGELKLQGVFGTAMAKLSHYFTPFQSFVVGEAESDKGHFDLPLALEILAREANYRAEGATPQGLFLYQFESISRNRLGYDGGLTAMAQDPVCRMRPGDSADPDRAALSGWSRHCRSGSMSVAATTWNGKSGWETRPTTRRR